MGIHSKIVTPKPSQIFLNFLVPSTLRMRALRAAASSKVARSQQTFSNSANRLTAVLFPQPTILELGRCQRLLNDSPYGHLHMKQQARYAFSTLNRTHIFIAINGRVALLYKFIERAVFAYYVWSTLLS